VSTLPAQEGGLLAACEEVEETAEGTAWGAFGGSLRRFGVPGRVEAIAQLLFGADDEG